MTTGSRYVVGVYAEVPAPSQLGAGFTSLATWTPDHRAGELLLSADPGFEIAWTARDGRIEGRLWLTPACPRPQMVCATDATLPVRMLRLRAEWVGAWLGPEASEFVGQIDLRDLGPRWGDAVRAPTEDELFEALIRLAPRSPDPLAHASLVRLDEPRPPLYRALAQEMGYSYEQWRRRMEAATGVSPKFLARYRRLRAASRLARSRPGMSMAELAFRTGFASDCALAAESAALAGRTFRALTGGFDLPE